MTTESTPPILVDQELSRRLESTEGRCSASLVDGRKQLYPNGQATWTEIGGAVALFDGTESPITQTFCLGMEKAPSVAEMEELEEFFTSRRADVFHEVSPLAAEETLHRLNERGYRPIEFTSVMARRVAPDIELGAEATGAITVREVSPDDAETWAETAAKGWSEFGDFGALMLDVARINAVREDAVMLLAELDDAPIAAAAFDVMDGVALLAGASTIPEARRRGAQLAMLERRLQLGAERGCDLAMMGARPGSSSQKNAERHGFRICYTRVKWKMGRRAEPIF